jgi:hypothetical protein
VTPIAMLARANERGKSGREVPKSRLLVLDARLRMR